MLDIEAYRQAESMAKAKLSTWRTAAAHSCDIFEKVGFPVRLRSMNEIGMILDTMQEGRSNWYLSHAIPNDKADMYLMTQSMDDALGFRSAYFPNNGSASMSDTVASCWALFLKMRYENPGFKRVLELGPGCGYLSFLLRRHETLEHYVQIEACESFYLLQYLVNLSCFHHRALECALDDIDIDPSIPPKSVHLPWWKIEEARKLAMYDIITANACLLEFTPEARAQYLALSHDVLKQDGVFIAQCFGSEGHGNKNDLLDEFERSGFIARSLTDAKKTNAPIHTGVFVKR